MLEVKQILRNWLSELAFKNREIEEDFDRLVEEHDVANQVLSFLQEELEQCTLHAVVGFAPYKAAEDDEKKAVKCELFVHWIVDRPQHVQQRQDFRTDLFIATVMPLTLLYMLEAETRLDRFDVFLNLFELQLDLLTHWHDD